MYLIDDSDWHADRRAADDERRRRLGLVKRVSPSRRSYVSDLYEDDQESPQEIARRVVEENLAQYIV